MGKNDLLLTSAATDGNLGRRQLQLYPTCWRFRLSKLDNFYSVKDRFVLTTHYEKPHLHVIDIVTQVLLSIDF